MDGRSIRPPKPKHDPDSATNGLVVCDPGERVPAHAISSTVVASAGLKAALSLLSVASAYADDVGCDVWEFAVDWETLRDHQVAPNDLRLLVRKGFVDHRVETTGARSSSRHFRSTPRLLFAAEHNFVLTSRGLARARAMSLGPDNTSSQLPLDAPTDSSVIPRWDRNSRCLYVSDHVVKQFHVPAGNQDLVLAAFQEEGWPPSIDDPLPPSTEIDSKRRLHDTIRRLNNHQHRRLLHFSGNGNGRAICWRIATNAPPLPRDIAGSQS